MQKPNGLFNHGTKTRTNRIQSLPTLAGQTPSLPPSALSSKRRAQCFRVVAGRQPTEHRHPKHHSSNSGCHPIRTDPLKNHSPYQEYPKNSGELWTNHRPPSHPLFSLKNSENASAPSPLKRWLRLACVKVFHTRPTFRPPDPTPALRPSFVTLSRVRFSCAASASQTKARRLA